MAGYALFYSFFFLTFIPSESLVHRRRSESDFMVNPSILWFADLTNTTYVCLHDTGSLLFDLAVHMSLKE